MTTSIVAEKRSPGTQQSRHAASWLGLAASPTFALMAWVSTNDAQSMLCASGPSILPVGNMAFMYLLMSFFHLSPWLKLAPALPRHRTQSPSQNRGD
ncbi:hypothetical protein [Chelatococcus asaccharovorans]|uniref:hypothetical protein n=1 Tax=Chelatococcus asaccharovorans TaxID=28210 RepID=UPI00224C6486|nr:hypothetical protein [Chelatococcus asaccharovorans]CAH1663717.1 conserved hypothetical protein [Chelatococcus asaccharovorans]CAH1682678.1 conserved hypothetical protein [Chelatococcus asaccharovorans]